MITQIRENCYRITYFAGSTFRSTLVEAEAVQRKFDSMSDKQKAKIKQNKAKDQARFNSSQAISNSISRKSTNR